MPPDPMRLIYLRLTGAGHDMHAAVVDRLCAMPSDLVFRVYAEKLPIGFVEMADTAVDVGYDRTIVDAVKNKPIHF